MKTALIVMLCALVANTAAAAAPDAKPLEFRLVVDCATGAKIYVFSHQGMQDSYCLSPDVILSRSDVVKAEIIHTSYGDEAARLTISGDAIARLTVATTANVGKRFAVIYNGHIASVPVVMEPITGNQLQIDVGSTGDSVEDLVADLSGGLAP